MNVTVTKAEYVALEQRLNDISAHVRSLVYVALHERAKGLEVWDENSRTESALEFLEVKLDELLIAALGSDAQLTDTAGSPYERMPAAVHDPEIIDLLGIRSRASRVRLPGEPDTPASVLGAIAGIADAVIEVHDRFDTPLGAMVSLIASLATGQITVDAAKQQLDLL